MLGLYYYSSLGCPTEGPQYTQSPKLHVHELKKESKKERKKQTNKQTNKQTSYDKQTDVLLKTCAQEALQNPALAQVWAVCSKPPET